MDPVLRLESLIEVLVPREHDIYAVFQEQGLEYRPQLEIRTMPLARGIQWMMEETDLPFLPGIAQLLFQPLELRLIHVVAVEGKKPYSVFGLEVIVTLPIHVEQLIKPLVGTIVISQGGIELDACIQKGLERTLEFPLVVSRPFTTVKVISQHDHKLKGKLCPIVGELCSYFILPFPTGSAVSDDRETNRILPAAGDRPPALGAKG
jgi:hypothetical protein